MTNATTDAASDDKTIVCSSTTTLSPTPPRKLRALVISMPGSDRQSHIEAMFADLYEFFEPPVFSEGVPQRRLRNRLECLRYCHMAGLVPDREWHAIQEGLKDPDLERQDPTRFLNKCLENVPLNIDQDQRRGSKTDLKVHYSIELWRKAKTINRGRAVLACTLAHLIALKKWYSSNDNNDDQFDMILEDNVRTTLSDSALRIWHARLAAEEYNNNNQQQQQQQKCHMRFLGWLGSIPNLQWILQRHVKARAFQRDDNTYASQYTIVPFPTTKEIMDDLELHGWDQPNNAVTDDTPSNNKTPTSPASERDDNDDTANDSKMASGAKAHTQPGGTPVWGSYAYWMSREGYHALLHRLQNDVGALLWKGKRGRFYHVKPADKVLPRVLMEHFGNGAVQLTTMPAFFRAPMLTSKIHTQFDPEFCKSTEYQLQQCGNLDWKDLWLTDEERQIVQHRQETGEWITLGALHDEHAQTTTNQSTTSKREE
ncbi:expressed unknown protein [Seminavis robusta]|uniref:Uncharacterized protein n=1 Tax=Seminavis robusta TaxID=568900 RepID=A0A9N8HMI7_9STRA|nr:expressed unknown protein [Seminavis robusta]|eukprot:Sro902_g218140.1 n/a (484) ;mRNA; r:13933-15384